MGKELSKDEFIQRLVDAGWKQSDALKEWEAIQQDTESGWEPWWK